MSAENPWDTRFLGDSFVYGTEPNAFLVEVADKLPRAGTVVSLGEGEGRNGVFLARRGLDVIGIDGSRVGVEKATRFAAREGVRLDMRHADLRDAELPAASAFVSIFCHLPSALRRDVHQRAYRALEAGGVFVIIAYRPEQIALGTGGPRDVDLLVRLDDLRADFPDAEVLLGEEVTRAMVEGTLHTGDAAVVQAVFRKPG